MASSDIRVTIGINLNRVEPSMPPPAPRNEVVLEIEPTPAIDGPSDEIMTPNEIVPQHVPTPRIDRPSEVVVEIRPPSTPTTNELVREILPAPATDISSKVTSSAHEMIMDIDEIEWVQLENDLIAGEECWPIHKVPHRLREVNPIAYEPDAISIGPYHYGKGHLKAMDVVKQSSFANIVKKTGLAFNEFLKSMETLRERALKCYEGPIHADLVPDVKFIEMMVYDGCFIVQLIRKMCPQELAKLPGHKRNGISHDLLLLENQLPFFVLQELDRIIFEKVEGQAREPDEFKRAALSYFFKKDKHRLQTLSISETYPSPAEDIKHLLDMVHKCCRPSPQGIKQHKEYIKTKEAKGPIRSWKFIRGATELENAGINFVVDEGKSLFEVTFANDTDIKRLKTHSKVLKIPTLYVGDYTERILRNLMAYEQFTQWEEPTYVSDYVVFMDNLVNTGKDVELLCTSGVIDNWLGDDEAVAQMFNKLRDFTSSKEDYYYAEIYDEVDKHCKGIWNVYMAKLRKDYFSSPWSLFSFIAAIVLLVATLVQTVYTVLSYHQS